MHAPKLHVRIWVLATTNKQIMEKPLNFHVRAISTTDQNFTRAMPKRAQVWKRQCTVPKLVYCQQ